MIPNSGAESSGGDPPGSRQRDVPAASAARSESAARAGSVSPTDGLLEQILSASSDEGGVESIPEPLMRQLKQVAGELAEEVFSLDPVMIRLVSVFTGRVRGLSGESLDRLARSVAGSLYDDINSRERVEKMWDALKRLASHEE